MKRALVGLLVAVAMSGCGVEGEPSSSMDDRVQALDADLSFGASGEQVRTLNEYLTSRGYYPDARLAAMYPAWRAPIPALPSDPSVFDERTVAAVRLFQANRGLRPTGIVDAETRATIKDVMCGVPDNIPTLDPSEKFALRNSPNGPRARGTYTWEVISFGNLSSEATLDALNTSFSSWRTTGSGLNFRRANPGETATFAFGFRSWGVNGPRAVTLENTTLFNSDLTWTLGNTNGGLHDLIHVAMHEIGHHLGFKHSAFRDALMFAGGEYDRTMTADDIFATAAFYKTHTQMPNITARDIAVGGGDEIWALNTETPNGDGNFRVVKFSPRTGTWDKAEPASTSTGIRIAVDSSGKPWVVKKDGKILLRTSSSPTDGSWIQITNRLATDIAVSANAVWITNKTSVNGGYQVCKLVANDFACSNGGAVRVSVTASGIPWIVAASGDVFRHSNNTHNTGTWEQLSGRISDIAVGLEHDEIPETPGKKIAFAWSVATNGAGKVNLAGYMEQPLVDLGLGDQNPPYTKGWLSGTAISAGGPLQAVAMRPDGNALVVDAVGKVFW